MIQLKTDDQSVTTTDPLHHYYRFHSLIYDMTRWSFLFGRNEMIRELDLQPGQSVLEIGCGTGKNLQKIVELYPETELWGIDLSDHMLKKASNKLCGYQNVELIHGKFGEYPLNRKFDLILCSYMLSMTGEVLKSIMENICLHLNENGVIAVVDFQNTRVSGFESWMQKNHVTMNGSLTDELSNRFSVRSMKLESAYLGLWKYVLFFGEKT